MPTNAPVPQPGQKAPDFRLRGPGGLPYTLSEHLGSPVVLVFFPEAFSPVCSHQMPGIQRRLQEFDALGAVVYGISVDNHHANSAFARALGLSFPLLSDSHHTTSAAYGIWSEEYACCARATFVVGRDGHIVMSDLSQDTGSELAIPGVDAALEAIRRA